MEQGKADPFLLAIIQQQEFLGMLGLGKIADPTSGETTKDLDKTRYAIGVLQMLETKTEGHLEEIEQRELQRVLTALRLNFVEEAKSDKQESGPEGE